MANEVGGPVLSIVIRPRGYELDADGLVPVGGFARWLEHARWSALGELSARVPLFARGVVRAQRWRWQGTVGFGATIEITTWVGRVGRTSLDFVHRLRDAEGRLVAFTAATIVRVGDAGPEPFPEAARALVVDDDAPETRPLDAVKPQPGTERFRRVVTASDLDPNRHMNQARFVELLDDARRFLAGNAGRGRPRAMHLDHLDEARQDLTVVTHAFPLDGGAVAAFVTDEGGRALAKARFEVGS